MGQFHLADMTEPLALAITRWRYPPPFDLYDLWPGDEDMLLDPLLCYYAVFDAAGLAGFACFGEDAQVIGGRYGEDALDIGFSMAPDRAGRGEGAHFVESVCRFAWDQLAADRLRLSVATFNRRAITVYRRLDFSIARWFVGTTRLGALSFVTMTRPRPREERRRPIAI